VQKRQSISINKQDVSTSISTQMDSLIPSSKIANITQGMFVGSVSDNFGQEIDQKIFHCKIIVDVDKVSAETAAYKAIPHIKSFVDEQTKDDKMKEVVDANYKQIKLDVKSIVLAELERINNEKNENEED
jgi:hypothetical protein